MLNHISVIGEALVDLVALPDGRTFRAHPGGSPANVAVGLARLDVPVTLMTALGQDTFGRLVAGHLRSSGVRLSPQPLRHTSVAVVSADVKAEAAYDFQISWDVSPPPPDPEAVAVHTGSLAAALGAAGIEAVLSNARKSATISYDPNIRPALLGSVSHERERVERQVAMSDVVKASAADLAWLYPGDHPHEVAQRWRSLGPGLVVISLGGSGALAAFAGETASVAAVPVDVVDTVGAGDAFMSGLLSGLFFAGLLGAAKRRELASASREIVLALLMRATEVAAFTCARQGADPPTHAELPHLRHAGMNGRR